MEPFDIPESRFAITEKNAEFLSGFNACLVQMYLYIAELTNFNPKNRMIDAVSILEKIGATGELISKGLKSNLGEKTQEKVSEVEDEILFLFTIPPNRMN